ncbi:BTB domain-containing protein [Aphelenchoides fujianensis]|nr:BTB domain-containing protein [Aphelenchoides fujianensis]
MTAAAKENAARQRTEYSIVRDQINGDFAIKVGEIKLKTRRSLLEACSGFFRLLFAASGFREARENCVEFPQFEAAPMQKVLRFCYANELPGVADGELIAVFKIAHYLEMPDLLGLCKRMAIDGLSKANVLEWLQIAFLCIKMDIDNTSIGFSRALPSPTEPSATNKHGRYD